MMPRIVSAIVILAATCWHPTLAWAQDDPTGDESPRVLILTPVPSPRPALLMPLYAGQIALQAYDGYSTIAGVRQGRSEANPLVGGLASQPAAFWAVKAASTATSIWLAEQLWPQHPRRAVVLMIIADGVMTAVAARNTMILRSAPDRH
jgi:hypothetical protein